MSKPAVPAEFESDVTLGALLVPDRAETTIDNVATAAMKAVTMFVRRKEPGFIVPSPEYSAPPTAADRTIRTEWSTR